MHVSRRCFSTLIGGLLATTALAACSTPGITLAVSQIETYAQDAINGAGVIIANFNLGSVAVNALANAKSLLAKVEAAGSEILLTTSQPLVSQIESDIQTVLSSVGSVTTIPASVSEIITAIEVTLPALLAYAQLPTTSAAPHNMTLSRAHAVLSNLKG